MGTKLNRYVGYALDDLEVRLLGELRLSPEERALVGTPAYFRRTGRIKPPVRGPRVPRRPRLREALAAGAGCPQKPGRDYAAEPLLMVTDNYWPIACPSSDSTPVAVPGTFDWRTGAILPCDVPCVMTRNRTFLPSADIVLSFDTGYEYDWPVFFGARLRRACPLQKLAIMSLEARYEGVNLARWRLAFWDFISSYQLESDVPAVYAPFEVPCFGPHARPFPWEHNASTALRVSPKRSDAMAIWVMSNCYNTRNRRLRVVQALMAAGVTVHIYGKGKLCLGTPDYDAWGADPANGLPDIGPAPYEERYMIKWRMMHQYKFYLAFENSDTPGYVSEKFYQPLWSGTIPVVLGPGDVGLFEPAPHSYIDINDFGGDPARLAGHLKHLDRNDTAFREYLAWRWRPPNQGGVKDSFHRLLRSASETHPHCRLCRETMRMMGEELGEAGPAEPPWEDESELVPKATEFDRREARSLKAGL